MIEEVVEGLLLCKLHSDQSIKCLNRTMTEEIAEKLSVRKAHNDQRIIST